MAESAAQRAKRESEEKGRGMKKLPLWWKTTIFASAGVLAFGKLVYSIEVFSITTLDNCILKPSQFDALFADATSAAAIVFFFATVAGFTYLESR